MSAATRRRRLLAIARDRLLELRAGSPLPELEELWTKREHGWAACGWSALFRNEASGTVIGLPDHCDQPVCPCCELRGVAKIRDRYRAPHDAALAEGRLWLVVLTIPNDEPGQLAAAMDRIRSAIGRLRRRSWWADQVLGGIWRLEVTVNLKTRTWHPHANLLFETRHPIRMADWQPLIQAEWRSVLGEDAEQWIWLLPGWSGTLAETVKRQLQEAAEEGEGHVATSLDYAVKPDPHWIDPSDPAWVVEYVEAMAGRRSVSSFGSWRGLPRPKREREEEVVLAPYAVGDDPFLERYLPELDPLTSAPAFWTFFGRGPRWSLRPHKPPGEHRQEWLVWHAADGTLDPSLADDDTALVYQAGMSLGPPVDV